MHPRLRGTNITCVSFACWGNSSVTTKNTLRVLNGSSWELSRDPFHLLHWRLRLSNAWNSNQKGGDPVLIITVNAEHAVYLMKQMKRLPQFTRDGAGAAATRTNFWDQIEVRVLTVGSQQEERQGGNSSMIQYELYMTINTSAEHIQLKFNYLSGMFKLVSVLLFVLSWLTQPEWKNVWGEVKSQQSDWDSHKKKKVGGQSELAPIGWNEEVSVVGCVGSRCCYGNSMMEQTDCRGMAVPWTSASSCPGACTQTHTKGGRAREGEREF